jgi:hypothetical protein
MQLRRKKKGQLDDQTLIEIERHHSVQDSCKNKRLNDTKKPIEPAVAMCQAMNEQLLTNKYQVLSRWIKYFVQPLNESSEEEPHANQEPQRENDYVIFDLSSRDEIVEAIEYLNDNKAAGTDSIAAELLKRLEGRFCLVNALNEMIQQV